ncbi:TldD/PmbA family protein [soil metagenome]
MTARRSAEEVVEQAVESLARAFVGSGEVFFRESASSSIEVRDGALENILAHGERGIGVRVIDAGRLGFAYTSDLSAEGVVECWASAMRMATVTEPDADLRIATGDADSADLGIHVPLEQRPVDQRAEIAFAVERAARAVDSRVSGFRETSYYEGEATTVIATTAGTRGSYSESWSGVSTSAIATDGAERQSGSHGEAARGFAHVLPEAVGRRAAEVAVGKLGARTIETQKVPVVFEPYEAVQLLGAISPLFSAENVLKGKSLFAGRIGTPVASPSVTIVDDPRRMGGLRSAPFDGEGTATKRRTLVERGELRGYLHSLKTAAKLGDEPSGSARRSSYSGPGRIGRSNFYIDAGTSDAAALVRGLGRALRITSLLNLHTIDPISGEFSLGATGAYLEDGERQYAVEGITIAGNLLDLLSSIAGVGDDLTFSGGIGSPTLVVSELSVGGT